MQLYRRKLSHISPKLKNLMMFSAYTLKKLDWPHEDKRTAVELIADLLFMGGDEMRFIDASHRKNLQRMFFITEHGSFGLGPLSIQCNDIVVILFGGQAPFILRPTDVDGEYHFIGDCYVDGIMHGEHIEKLKAEGKFEEQKTSFTLV
jgi:hypothetical protein